MGSKSEENRRNCARFCVSVSSAIANEMEKERSLGSVIGGKQPTNGKILTIALALLQSHSNII